MFFAALKFTVALLILKWMPLRLFLTPGRDQASPGPPPRGGDLPGRGEPPGRRAAPASSSIFHWPNGARRSSPTRRSLRVTDDHTWGEAMTALLADVRQGKVGDGIAAAVERVGVVLAEHFPRSAANSNEIPDKLIEL